MILPQKSREELLRRWNENALNDESVRSLASVCKDLLETCAHLEHYRDFLEILSDYQTMPRKEFDETHGGDISEALDTYVAQEMRNSRFEILKDFVKQISETGRIKIAGDDNNVDYVYDFCASPWIEREYVVKERYEAKIAGIKKILSGCESL